MWSALEYAGHVRDALALFAERTRLALTVDNPQFQYLEQDAAVVEGRYNDSDPRQVAADIATNAQRFLLLLQSLLPDGWQRAGTRREGEQFDVALLARFALHEARHHRMDAERAIHP